MKVQDGHGQPWGKKIVLTSISSDKLHYKKNTSIEGDCLLPEQGPLWDSVLHSVGASPGWLELWFQWRFLCLSHPTYDLGPTKPSINRNIFIHSYTTTGDLSALGNKNYLRFLQLTIDAAGVESWWQGGIRPLLQRWRAVCSGRMRGESLGRQRRRR